MRFEDMNYDSLNGIIQKRETVSVIGTTRIFGFDNLEGFQPETNADGTFETAPTINMMTSLPNIATMMASSPQDERGDWEKFLFLIYRNGGRIFFTKLDDTDYEAQIIFSK